MGVKYSQMFIQITAGWGPLPISVVLRSEGSLKIGDTESGVDFKIREQY